MAPPARPRPPSVERLLAAVRPRLPGAVDRRVLADAARAVVDRERRHPQSHGDHLDRLADEVLAHLHSIEGAWSVGLEPVINGTGVIVHTNLGRTAWPVLAIEAAERAAR